MKGSANKNNIPVGYKQSAVGVIPEEWAVKKLEDLGKFYKGKGVSKSELVSEGKPCLTYGEIYTKHNHYIREFKSFLNEESIKKSFKLEYGDILFAGSGEKLEDIGKSVAYINKHEAYAGGDIIILRQSSANPLFLGYLTNHETVERQKYKIGQGHSVVHIYSSSLSKIQIPLPPLPEQKKIAEILSRWDLAIEKCEAAISTLKKRNKGLAQQLLKSPLPGGDLGVGPAEGKHLRLKGFEGEWKEVQLGDIAKQVKLFNKKNRPIEVFSCTKYDGLVPSLKYFGRQVYGNDLSKYKIVPFGAFAYATNHIDEGSIGYQDISKEGLVSPMYTVFKTNDNVDDNFLFKLLKTDRMIYQYQSNISGSINRRGGLRWNDFSKIKITIPPIEEQKAILNILQQADRELSLLKSKRANLQKQKEGLMQKLLTGEVRVK